MSHSFHFSAPELTLSPLEGPGDVSKFDITLKFEEKEDELVFGVEYNSDIYAQERIERIINHFKNLVSNVLKEPLMPINELEIMGVEEVDKILADDSESIAIPLKDVIDAEAKRAYMVTAYLMVKYNSPEGGVQATSFVFGTAAKSQKDLAKVILDTRTNIA